MWQAQHHEVGDFKESHSPINRGDIMGVRGFIGKSKKGELSVFPQEVKLLTACLRMLPKDHEGLKDTEVRFRTSHTTMIWTCSFSCVLHQPSPMDLSAQPRSGL